MKQWPFLQCASVILILAMSMLSWADDDDDDEGGPLTSPITGETREFTLDLNVVEDYEIRPAVPAEGGGNLAPALVDLWAYACRSASGAVVPNCGPGADPTLPGPFLLRQRVFARAPTFGMWKPDTMRVSTWMVAHSRCTTHFPVLYTWAMGTA